VNIESFLERWNRMGKQRQLITILMALLKQMAVAERAIPLNMLDDISAGESVLMMMNGDDLVLRYSPEQTELLTIQEAAPWTANGPSPYANSQKTSVLTDQHQAELEKKRDNMKQVREAASRIRGKGLESLVDDQPPLS
jgi:hypothetical protein